MTYKDCVYYNTDETFQKVKAFLTRLQYVENHDNNWDPSRFDWWRYSYHHDKDQAFFQANAHYWVDEEDQIVALAISEYGDKDIFVIVDPILPVLYESVLDWSINVFGRGKDRIVTSIFMSDSHKVKVLEAAGFKKDKHENNVRSYDLTDYDFNYSMPEGYQIMTFQDYGNYESKIALICSAFNKREHPKSRIDSFMKTPGYDPEMDLIVVNNQGQAAAYCTGWIEQYDSSLGFIEPMGTHAEHRRLGLATALAKECFKRLYAKGVTLATIASAAEPNPSNLLYDSLKPIDKRSGYEFVYRKS